MLDYTPIADLLEIVTGLEKQLVGSTAINGEGEDIDIAIKMPPLHNLQVGFTQADWDGAMVAAEARRAIIRRLQEAGCETSGGAHYQTVTTEADTEFVSLRRGAFNLLLCFNDSSWNRFVVGRDMCIFLRELGVDMTEKTVRVAVHGMAAGMNIQQLQNDQERLAAR